MTNFIQLPISRAGPVPEEQQDSGKGSRNRWYAHRRRNVHGDYYLAHLRKRARDLRSDLIIFEQALRQVVFGSCANPPRGEWSRTGLTLRAGGQAMAFGIRAARNSTRSLVTAVQAVMLKHFLFKNTPSLKRVITGGTIAAGNSSVLTPAETLLKPNHERQVEVLSLSIAEVIWRCGSADATINHSQGDTANFGITSPKAIVVLPQDIPYVQHSSQYFQDGITETLHVFEFSNLDDLQIFVKRYLYLFQDEGGPGAIILLYSAVLSRGIARIRNDLEDPRTSILPGCPEEGPVSIVILLLTGRCSPHLHNGVLHVGDENTYAIPRWGVLTRSEVGILVHDGEVAGGVSRQPGSRLKTPSLPIWVTLCQGHFGVLFNTNRELLRNYHAERRFEIHYYTTSGSNVTLTVDTRAVNSRDIASAGANNLPDSRVPRDMQEQIVDVATTPLEKLIHTKWQDAQIQWNGTPVL
ncbi:inactive ubiquitin carboxyl-terminal hydrolase MINDY-4B isoform X2 [Athalia rosae]|uniref:inactive ubiquitin carboxyl-terminal hydrolase MINDY-4B isoform X2 n=1 Tax=Athalia rosae TaxID=37344 RepID=UPI0020338530|nr:inactive ubiquitin carboxyl-terminal hydrolase MINDY-4B isoform X2 [Athalia rosae]XP_020711429.2 inactive ubiquitin carboxyl-terminal hydrolase MINDY-4B isoform X2 [Athalia rosae]